MPCPGCGRGFHDECYSDCEECHPISGIEESLSNNSVRSIGNQIKEPEDVTDRHSTGRKRAAFLYPLFKNEACEWQGLKNCGGGLNPVIGCIDGKQMHRHHGPVKDTLRNEKGNVHRICNPCHSRWHAKNNAVYDEVIYNKLPHSPEAATELELLSVKMLESKKLRDD